MDVTIDFSGLEKAHKTLYAYSQQLGDRVVVATLLDIARTVRNLARSKAPRVTGWGRRAITVKRSKIYSKRRSSDAIGVYMTVSEKDAFYMRILETGWNVRGKKRTEANTAWKWNRAKTRKRFSRAESKGRQSLPGKRDIPGRKFMDSAFKQLAPTIVGAFRQRIEIAASIIEKRLGR